MSASERAREPVPSVELHVLMVVVDVLLRDRSAKARERVLKDITAELEWFAQQGAIMRLHAPCSERMARAVMEAAPTAWRPAMRFLNRPR